MPKRTDRARPAARPAEDDTETAPAATETTPAPADEEEATEPVTIEDEEIVGLDEAQEEDHFFGLWYGIPGSTKTTSIARILLARPEGKLLVCNAEGGLKVRALRQHGIPTERIAVWPKPGVRPTFDSLERLVFKVDAELAAARKAGAPKPYCAFALDSVTELVKLMLDNIQEDGIAGQRELDKKAREAGVNPPRRSQRARFKSERDDYALVANQMRAILRRLRYMDLDFLVTALVRRDEDQDTGAVMYGPAAPPALQQDLLGYADIVIRTERRANDQGMEEVVGYSQPDENHHGKDRYGLLPAEMLPPGADVVLGHIVGEVIDSPSAPPAGAEDVDTAPAETEPEQAPAEEPAKKPAARRTRKTTAAARGNGRIDPKTMSAVGEGDGSTDEPPY
jgi:hypothetical protein